MSRSFKKHPIYTDSSPGTTKKAKKYANKRVRETEDLPAKGCTYKKIYPQYGIHDFIRRWTWEEAKANYESWEYDWLNREFPTLSSYYRYWFKICKGK